MAIGNNIQIINSFSMKNAKPLDDRELVESIEEMLAIPSYLQWIGMQVYVANINTRFKWDGTSYNVEHLGFCSGNGVPTTDQYLIGDIYIDKDTGDLYYKEFSNNNISWVLQANIRGPQGIQGEEGIRGVHGSYWYSGVGIDGTDTTAQIFVGSGVDTAEYHDMYINTNTGNLYMCEVAGDPTIAKWSYTGTSLQGPQGIQGLKGDPGKPGEQGQQGETGPQGIRGNNTFAGYSIYGTTETTGKVFPDATEISNDNIISSDIYINSYFGHVFKALDEGKGNEVHWYRSGNIKGASIYVSSVIDPAEDDNQYTFPTSDIEYANEGDYNINPTSGKLARCMVEGDPSSASWQFMGYFASNRAVNDMYNHEIGKYIYGIACLQNKTLTVTQGDGTQSNIQIIINQYTGATETTSGVEGLVPVAAAGDQNKFLKADGTWAEIESVDGYLKADGSIAMTGDLNLAGYLIIGLKDPENDSDAVTKSYVDTAISNISITCDDALSDTSENPVKNKVITEKINEMEEILTQVKSVVDKYSTMLNIIGNYK